MVMYIVLGIIGIFAIYIIILYNNIIGAKIRVKESFSTMDVYLKKRWDLIPNMINIVKSYADYEEKTLTEIIKLRTLSYDNLKMKEKIKTNEEINYNLEQISLLVEKYPNLRANDNYQKLSEELIQIENDIANARKYYNGTVRIFNNNVEKFPNNILARLIGYKSLEMFMAKNEEKENVEVNL